MAVGQGPHGQKPEEIIAKLRQVEMIAGPMADAIRREGRDAIGDGSERGHTPRFRNPQNSDAYNTSPAWASQTSAMPSQGGP